MVTLKKKKKTSKILMLIKYWPQKSSIAWEKNNSCLGYVFEVRVYKHFFPNGPI